MFIILSSDNLIHFVIRTNMRKLTLRCIELKSDNVYDFNFPCNKTPYECTADNVTHDKADDETLVEGMAKVTDSGPVTIIVEEYVYEINHQFKNNFVSLNTIGESKLEGSEAATTKFNMANN